MVHVVLYILYFTMLPRVLPCLADLALHRGLGFRVLGDGLGSKVFGDGLGFRVFGDGLGFRVLGDSLGFTQNPKPQAPNPDP